MGCSTSDMRSARATIVPGNTGAHGGPMNKTGQDKGEEQPMFLYRFRSTHSLLKGFEELERQEIFFAAPEELNDPLEGLTNIVWQGDAILWRNLLRHYLLCLLDAAFSALALGPEFRPETYVPKVRMTDEDLPEAPIRGMYAAICRTFLDHQAPRLFIAEADRLGLKLGREGLAGYLRLLQPLAIGALFRVLAENGLPVLKPDTDLVTPPPELASHLRRLLEAHEELGANAEVLCAIGEKTGSELALINDYNRDHDAGLAGLYFLYRDFPRAYIDRLGELMFPGWYTASFVEVPANAAMWGVYGDSHRGACLQFRTTENKEGKRMLPLSGNFGGSSGATSPVTANFELAFEPVCYADDYPEIDFFTMLGTLSRTKLDEFWYAGHNGGRRAKAARILSENTEWHRDYWASHASANTTKLPDWAHEAEQRLVLTGMLEDRLDPVSRKLRYRAGDLAGIVFGMKTSHAEKLAIMRVIDRKLSPEQRRRFTFYQARFSCETKCLEHVPLHLLSPQD